jgi:hypothetical protein
VATFGLAEVTLAVDGLGEVRPSSDVRLSLKLSRKLAEVTLYRDGVPIKTWHNADTIDWTEKLSQPAAYVFGARDGAARLLTSAIWYEPPPKSH